MNLFRSKDTETQGKGNNNVKDNEKVGVEFVQEQRQTNFKKHRQRGQVMKQDH